MMARTKFELKNLHKIDGLSDEFARLLTAATEDCINRLGISKKRQVTIVVECEPNENDTEKVIVNTYCKSRTPVRAASPYMMNTTVRNELTFQPGSPLDPDQGSLFDDE